MQVTFDHTDLANPEALAILRRIVSGGSVQLGGVSNRPESHPLPVISEDAVKHAVGSFAEEVRTAALTDLETPPAPETVERAFAVTIGPPPVPMSYEEGMRPAATVTPVAEVSDYTDSSLLDSSGIMWDARIHASTRTKVSDGTWKMKRGVEPELVAQVMAELKGAPAPTKVEQFAAQVDPSTLGFGATVPTPPTVAAVPVPPVPVPLADVGDWPADLLGPHRAGFEFQAFMSYVMGLVNSGIPTPTLLSACKEHDVASFNAVNGRPEVIPALARALSQLQKAA